MKRRYAMASYTRLSLSFTNKQLTGLQKAKMKMAKWSGSFGAEISKTEILAQRHNLKSWAATKLNQVGFRK